MKAYPTIGTTTYGFRYLLLDEQRAPTLRSIVEKVRECGLDTLQICENARPLRLPHAEWQEVIRVAADVDVELHLGCMTLDVETLWRYLDRAAGLPRCRTLRIVMENEEGGPPARDVIAAFLDRAALLLERAGMRLAIENHFHIACSTLAEVVNAYPPSLIGFCIDTANSLRKFEPPEQVFAYLGTRAVFYHLKDYVVRGSNVGFSVVGAPLGEGDLDTAGCLDRILAHDPGALIFLENWVPATGDRDRDVAADAEWLTRSLENLLRLAPSSFSRGSGTTV